MAGDMNSRRLERAAAKTKQQMQLEVEEQESLIRQEPDYLSEIEPFLTVLKNSLHPEDFRQHTGTQLVMSLCIQIPPELFHAAGVRSYKLACGSYASQNMSSRSLPALTCPMIKSITGMLQTRPEFSLEKVPIVIPTTCDWVVKWRELAGLDNHNKVYLDLPHLRENEQASEKWLKEIYGLKKWLESFCNKKITGKALRQSVNSYMKAYDSFFKLIELRRSLSVPSTHFAVIANALACDSIEHWMVAVADYNQNVTAQIKKAVPLFLAGSPVVFPNLKLLNLIEAAGMRVAADDICSMERVLPGPACYEDPSEYAVMRALSERTHKACICPTFADNDRRLNSMVNILKTTDCKGVLFHVLKGCHPYDIESVIIENKLKALGYRFLKIETDYVKEDDQTIVTRLEAFRQSLL